MKELVAAIEIDRDIGGGDGDNIPIDRALGDTAFPGQVRRPKPTL